MARLEFGPTLTSKEQTEIDGELKALRDQFDAGAQKRKNTPARVPELREDHKPALRAELMRIQAEHEAEKRGIAERHAAELAAAHAARESAELKLSDQQRRLNTRLTDPRVFAKGEARSALETAKTRAIVRSDLIYDEREGGEDPRTVRDEVVTRFPTAERDDMPGVLRDNVAGGWGERMYKRFMTWARSGK